MTPPAKTTPSGIPIQRVDTRDEQRPKHSRLATVEPDPQDLTGRFEGVELDEARERRDPDERTRHLEKRADKADSKMDEIDAKVDRIEVTMAAGFATITAKLETLPGVVTLLRDELQASRQDKHTVIKQTLDIDQINANARAQTAVIAVTGRWRAIATIAGGVFSVGTISALLALLASGRC